MGRTPKKINRHFFDKGSEAMYYVLGALYSSYNPTHKNGIEIRSSSRDLVQIIKDCLESEHSITSDPRDKNSHCLAIYNSPYLHFKLEEMGLVKDKYGRKFPKYVPKKHLNHFIRGFFDAEAKVKDTDTGRNTYMEVSFNHPFLKDLHNILLQYANVQGSGPIGNRLHYSPKDTSKIYDFIYRDWDFIKESGLYLSSKKEQFKPYKPIDYYKRPESIAASGKIEMVKKLLAFGKRPFEIFKKAGFKNQGSIYIAFKRKTGQTITGYKRGLHLSPLQALSRP